MDSPVVNQLLRTLFSRPSAGCLRNRTRLRLQQCRTFYARRGPADSTIESRWTVRSDVFPQERSKEFKTYPLVTADELRTRKTRPRKVRMLLRDFIEDSLYNPSYGYFSKQVVIFNPGDPFDFKSMRNEFDFHNELARRYTEFEDVQDEKEKNDARQLWHTPTELFRPAYGEALARYLVSNYQLNLYPYHDLLIYEMGAGNGTLMLNILDYIRATEPSVYDRTKFKVIEISSTLASQQASSLMRSAENRGHKSHIEIVNRSIFDWTEFVSSPCFFLALEVFDNFAHDCIRYHPVTEQPYQSNVVIDGDNNFFEYFSPTVDPVAERFLRARNAACAWGPIYDHPLHPNPLWLWALSMSYLPSLTMGASRAWRRARSSLPFAPNMSPPEYIPTRLMQFFEKLNECFPAHKLVTSDFHVLPDAVPGINAPVVQTRYKRQMLTVRTPLVHQGFFDILFPTDFQVMEAMYRSITGNLTRVLSHEDFLLRWAYVEETATKNGENPMLTWYKNASVLTTV